MGFHIYMYISFLVKIYIFFFYYFFLMINSSNNIFPSNAHFLVEYAALFPKICNIMAVNGL